MSGQVGLVINLTPPPKSDEMAFARVNLCTKRSVRSQGSTWMHRHGLIRRPRLQLITSAPGYFIPTRHISKTPLSLSPPRPKFGVMAQELKKATKPTWYDPLKSASLADQPVLKVYNSLTKEKVSLSHRWHRPARQEFLRSSFAPPMARRSNGTTADQPSTMQLTSVMHGEVYCQKTGQLVIHQAWAQELHVPGYRPSHPHRLLWV